MRLFFVVAKKDVQRQRQLESVDPQWLPLWVDRGGWFSVVKHQKFAKLTVRVCLSFAYSSIIQNNHQKSTMKAATVIGYLEPIVGQRIFAYSFAMFCLYGQRCFFFLKLKTWKFVNPKGKTQQFFPGAVYCHWGVGFDVFLGGEGKPRSFCLKKNLVKCFMLKARVLEGQLPFSILLGWHFCSLELP